MAALIRHGYVGSSIFGLTGLITLLTAPVRHYRIRNPPKRRGRTHNRRRKPKLRANYKSKWEWDENSLLSRGFLRSLPSYDPPHDVVEKLGKICKDKGISADNSITIESLAKKFEFFNACAKEFNYFIPNSMLHTIETIDDLKKFYETPTNRSNPMDEAKKIPLPPNLHIIYEYNRFHPDTDTKFGGKTAFPKSSTLVTSIKYRKKYRSLILSNPYMDIHNK